MVFYSCELNGVHFKTEGFSEKPKKTLIEKENDNESEKDSEKDSEMDKGREKEIARGREAAWGAHIDEPPGDEGSATPFGSAALPQESRIKEALVNEGIPTEYMDERWERGLLLARKRSLSVADVIRDWWREDRAKYRSRTAGQAAKKEGLSDLSQPSFDVDEFFRVALEYGFGDVQNDKPRSE